MTDEQTTATNDAEEVAAAFRSRAKQGLEDVGEGAYELPDDADLIAAARRLGGRVQEFRTEYPGVFAGVVAAALLAAGITIARVLR